MAREHDKKQTRKKHRAAFKAKVALAAIKGGIASSGSDVARLTAAGTHYFSFVMAHFYRRRLSHSIAAPLTLVRARPQPMSIRIS
jgi:hypothetical protein